VLCEFQSHGVLIDSERSTPFQNSLHGKGVVEISEKIPARGDERVLEADGAATVPMLLT